MITQPRILVGVGAVCAALLLAGCSSSGTISGSSKGGSSGGFIGGSSAGSSSGGSSSGLTGGDDSDAGASDSGGGDAGCAEAATAIQNAEQAQHSNDPQSVLKSLQTSISQLHDAASKTKKPGGKDAINKVADDLNDILSQAQSGQEPDTSQAFDDADALAQICGD